MGGWAEELKKVTVLCVPTKGPLTQTGGSHVASLALKRKLIPTPPFQSFIQTQQQPQLSETLLGPRKLKATFTQLSEFFSP